MGLWDPNLKGPVASMWLSLSCQSFQCDSLLSCLFQTFYPTWSSRTWTQEKCQWIWRKENLVCAGILTKPGGKWALGWGEKLSSWGETDSKLVCSMNPNFKKKRVVTDTPNSEVQPLAQWEASSDVKETSLLSFSWLPLFRGTQPWVIPPTTVAILATSYLTRTLCLLTTIGRKRNIFSFLQALIPELIQLNELRSWAQQWMKWWSAPVG